VKHRIASLVLARLAIALVTAIIVSFAVFFATAMLPGDTATILLGQAATPEAVEGLREAMHLDDPAIFRFLRWLVGVVHGDLGVSYANNMPVAKLIAGRLVNTLKLAGLTAVRALDGDLQPVAVGRRRQGVAARGLVAVLRGQAYVDVLAGQVAGPLVDLEHQCARARRLGPPLEEHGGPPGAPRPQSPWYRCSRHGSP